MEGAANHIYAVTGKLYCTFNFLKSRNMHPQSWTTEVAPRLGRKVRMSTLAQAQRAFHRRDTRRGSAVSLLHLMTVTAPENLKTSVIVWPRQQEGSVQNTSRQWRSSASRLYEDAQLSSHTHTKLCLSVLQTNKPVSP